MTMNQYKTANQLLLKKVKQYEQAISSLPHILQNTEKLQIFLNHISEENQLLKEENARLRKHLFINESYDERTDSVQMKLQQENMQQKQQILLLQKKCQQIEVQKTSVQEKLQDVQKAAYYMQDQFNILKNKQFQQQQPMGTSVLDSDVVSQSQTKVETNQSQFKETFGLSSNEEDADIYGLNKE